MNDLIDILELIDESQDVVVVNEEGNVVGNYDGKNSIPLKYNACSVNKIWVDKGAIVISINADEKYFGCPN